MLLYDSNTTFWLILSLPLLIRRLNVPDDVFGETTSHLTLSLVPLVRVLFVPVVPDEFCSAPSANDSKINELWFTISSAAKVIVAFVPATPAPYPND